MLSLVGSEMCIRDRPESHASVSCPHCGSLVSYFSDLEFHNCSGEF
jgi:hypothetical protein